MAVRGFDKKIFEAQLRAIINEQEDELQKHLEKLQKKIVKKIKAGREPTEAIDEALSETDFFQKFDDGIVNSVYLAACAGYGILPSLAAKADSNALKSKLLSEAWRSDKMTLSESLYNNHRRIRERITEQITTSLLAADSIQQLARKLYDGYQSEGKDIIPPQKLPKYLRKIYQDAQEVAQGDLAALNKLRRNIKTIKQNNVANLKSDPLRAAYENLLKAAEDLNEKALEKAAYVAVQEQTRYVATRLARTEAAAAWFDGYMAERYEDEDIWGFRWVLSSRHAFMPFDQCDVCANMDVGFGPGLYPKERVPECPLHPHCMCMLEEVYVWEVRGGRFNPEGAREYLDSLPEDKQQALFGKEGKKIYQNGGDWQNLLRGWDQDNFHFVPKLAKNDFVEISTTTG